MKFLDVEVVDAIGPRFMEGARSAKIFMEGGQVFVTEDEVRVTDRDGVVIAKLRLR